MGQDQVRLWADQAGLVINASNDHDATGWDLILEWPQPTDYAAGLASLTPDRHPAPVQCLLQVKATDSASRRPAVSVANWLRLVQTPLPCFLILLQYDGLDDCQRAILIHVGESKIRKVLRRARELGVRRQSPALHRHTMAVTWRREDQLTALSGRGLESAILSRIGGSLESYATRKLALVRTAGYELGGKRLNVQVRPPEGWEGDPRHLLIDFYLGIVPYVELQSGELVDARFGIAARTPDQRFSSGRLESVGVAPSGKARLHLAAPNVERELHLLAEAYLPTGLPKHERVKARFAVPFLDLIWSLVTPEVQFRLNLPDPTTNQRLSGLQPAAEFLLLLDAAHRGRSQVEFHVHFDGTDLGRGRLQMGNAPGQPLLAWAGLVHSASTVAKFFNLPPDLEVRVSDLAHGQGPLALLNAVLRPYPAYIRAEFTVPEEPEEPDRPWCLPLVVTARLAEYSAQVSAAAFGHPLRVGTAPSGEPRYFFASNDVRLEAHRLFVGVDRPEHSDGELADRVAAKYSTTMNVVILRN